jgi:hypothetical protein
MTPIIPSMPNLSISTLVVFAVSILLAPATIVFVIQHFIIIPRAKRQLFQLNSRRAERARLALSGEAQSEWDSPAPTGQPVYAFSGWVELLPGGSVKIAGQAFGPNEPFEATATDESNIPRAAVVSKGLGEILITSHGQLFRARFINNCWEVQQINGLSS